MKTLEEMDNNSTSVDEPMKKRLNKKTAYAKAKCIASRKEGPVSGSRVAHGSLPSHEIQGTRPPCSNARVPSHGHLSRWSIRKARAVQARQLIPKAAFTEREAAFTERAVSFQRPLHQSASFSTFQRQEDTAITLSAVLATSWRRQ